MRERISERRKVIDILDKMNFFQGQRAGRELWNDKPQNVQEEDLDNFNRDIRTIRDYIYDLEHELKQYHNLEEQGLLLKLPCKPNEEVWMGHDKYSLHKCFYACNSHIVSDLEDGFVIGRTKEEAEEALRKKVE